MTNDTAQLDDAAVGSAVDELSTGTDYEALAGRFRPLFETIRATALEREKERALPYGEIRALKEAGFGAVRVPKKYGGAGASLPQLIELLIELAEADSNIPQSLRGHFAFVEDRLNAHATADQSEWFARFVSGDLVGNAWTEVGAVEVGTVDTKVTPGHDGWVVNGEKYYSTGSIFADWIDVFSQRSDTDELVIAAVSTHQDAVAQQDDWDGFGQRTTGSGTSTFRDALVLPENVFPFESRFKYQTAFYQLVLLAVLAGSTRAAAREVAAQAKGRTRVYSNGVAPVWSDDPQIQQVVGEATSQGFAATAIAVRSAEASQAAYLARYEFDDARELEANIRAELDSAQGQVVLVKLALEATSTVLNALGASGVSESKRLDRFWRNARTASSHNPVVFKARIVGDWAINGTPPPYVWWIGASKSGPASGKTS
ncbi:acyl-CoA dehydrogenase family protein [Subtercola sp. PAMC28395]|uniref:acyl-CoA dehydrogenase family protein n=1 Tax=Subtercola sp. PAMC28395 TaxID=2846775 RepID=UPI001C0B8E5A|nr:acyl-CoA dehydrogenase family protein [Subtercola sp. PAMC28395]QWT24068.1 acyl-CoA dehydrogenase family protein [Subtercola sp. PAMC28395]